MTLSRCLFKSTFHQRGSHCRGGVYLISVHGDAPYSTQATTTLLPATTEGLKLAELPSTDVLLSHLRR